LKRALYALFLCACSGHPSDAPDGAHADFASAPDDQGVASDLGGDLGAVDLAQDDLLVAMCPPGATPLTTTTCPGAATPPSSAMKSELVNAIRGDVIAIDPGEGTVPCVPVLVCTSADAPTLLFSDEPEAPTSDGILYAATVPAGPYRVFAYHVNGAGSGQRKISVVALNHGAADATITFGHRGSAGPSTNYVVTGALAAQAWLTSSTGATLTVPAGQRVVVDGTLDGLHAGPGELVIGQLDFSTSDTLKISVVTVDAAADAASSTATLSLLPSDGLHVRGTFPGATLTFVPASWPDDGVRHLRLGAGGAEPLMGVDAVDGDAPVMLGGDYGVRYTLVLPDGMRGYGLSPRGGAWGGAASIPAGDDHPIATTTTLGADADATSMIVLGRFSQAATIDLFTAGGSNLPVDLVVVPL